MEFKNRFTKVRIIGRLRAVWYLIGKYTDKRYNLAFYREMLLFLMRGYSNKLKFYYTNYMLIKLTDSMFKDTIIDIIFNKHIYKLKYPKRDPTIVDIGANVGLTTLYFKKIFPRAKVYAYEPYLPAFTALEENIAINDYADGVLLFNSAVTKRSFSKKTLYVSDESSLMSSFYKDRIPKAESMKIKKVAVRTVSLRSVLKKVENIDILKINIEGGEYQLVSEILKYSDQIHSFIIGFHRLPNKHPFTMLDKLSKKYAIGIKSLASNTESSEFTFSSTLKENFYAYGASRAFFRL